MMRIRKGKAIRAKRSMLIAFNVIVVITVCTVSIIWFKSESIQLQERITDLKDLNFENQKNYIQNEVNRFIDYIEFTTNDNPSFAEDSLKIKAIKWAQTHKLKHGGYLFINEYNGQALLYDGKIISDELNLENLTDKTGKRLFDMERKAYHSKTGHFLSYYFKPLHSDIPEPKISFVKGYSKWEWIIGAGVYINNSEKEIANLENEFASNFKQRVKYTFLICLIVVVMSSVIVLHIYQRLVWQINMLTRFFKKAARSNDLVDVSLIQYFELKEMGEAINTMIRDSRLLTQEIQNKDFRLKSIFDAADNIGFVITDLGSENTLVTEFSPGAEKIFRFTKHEIINKPVALLHKQEDVENFPRMQELLKKGKKGFQGETQLKRKNGDLFYALFTIHPLVENDKIIGTIGVTIDITKRIEAEKELKKLKANLEKEVEKRSGEIMKKNEELMKKNSEMLRMHDLFVGREFRIKELKDKIRNLESKLDNNK